MAKNITVIGENGNILYSTYPKRAKGLVKKGRAHWVSEEVIRMRADNEEANEMANNIYEIFDNQISKMQEQLRGEQPETAAPVRIQILKTMETFRAQEQGTKIIDLVSAQLKAMQESMDKEPYSEDNAAAREATRQEMLSLMKSLMNNGQEAEVKKEAIKDIETV